jgi:hypothetical protein
LTLPTKFLQLINNEFLCIKDTEGKRFYLFNIKSKQISTIDYPTDKTSNAILSPNGKYILYTADNILSDKDKEIHLYNIESKETTIICKNETMVGISNNSMYIITKFNMTPDIEESTHNGCHIWDLNGNLLFTYSSDSETVAGSTFSWSDENYLLFDTLSYDKEGNSITNVKLLDINSGQIKKFSSEYGSGIISPDARYSLLIGHTNQLLNLLTGDVASFELPGWAIRSKNINKEGDKAAITILTDGGEIKVYILTIIV